MKRMVLLGQLLCITLATLMLGIPAWLDGQRLEALLTLGIGLIWILFCFHSLAWVDGLMLILFTFLAVYGIFRERSVLPGFISITFVLTAWNLGYINRRLEFTSNPGIRQKLISNHVRRASYLLAIALVFATTGAFLRLELNLGTAILVGALGIIGLSQLVGYLLKQKES